MGGHSFAIPLPLDPSRPGRTDGPVTRAPIPALPGGHTRRFRSGEVVLPEGRRPAWLVVLHTGAAGLIVPFSHSRCAVVGVIGPGDVVGEDAIGPLDGLPVMPEVRALTPVSATFVPHHDLKRALGNEPLLGLWLAQAIGARMAETHARLARVLSLRIRDRLLAELRSLGTRWGRPSRQGTVVDLCLSQELLAALIGASRESVNRAARRLQRDGAILRRGRRYVLVQPGPPAGEPAP